VDSHVVSVAPEVTVRVVVPEDSVEPNAVAMRRGEYPATLRPLITVLRALAAPGSKVLDLGGYLGGFALAAAALGYDVVVVEASELNASCIRRSVAANAFVHPVRVLQAAVGATNGSVNFCAHGPWGHVETPNAADSSTGVVRQLTLPAVLQEVGWTEPDFIKMDVEGSEVRVLRSAASWFREGHRPTLLYEANGHTLDWFGDSPAALRALVAAFGYVQYEVDEEGRLRQPNGFEPWCVMDYLASPKPLTDALPARTFLQLAGRTMRALRAPSSPARKYAWKTLKGLFTGMVRNASPADDAVNRK